MTEIGPQIGFCSWSVAPDDPAHLAHIARELNIPTVSLALVPLLDQPEQWRDAGSILAGAGISILSGMMATRSEDYSTLESIARTGGVRPDETWPENLELARRIADLAAGLALSLVTLHAGFLPESPADPERAIMRDRLVALAEIFTANDIAIALETGQETAPVLLDFLSELNHPGVGVNFDPANMILYGKGNPVDAFRKLSPPLRQIHIKDALPTDRPGTWGTEVPVGKGAVDWPAFFAIASNLNPPVNFIIEREAGADRLDDIRRAARLFTDHLTPHLTSAPEMP